MTPSDIIKLTKTFAETKYNRVLLESMRACADIARAAQQYQDDDNTLQGWKDARAAMTAALARLEAIK